MSHFEYTPYSPRAKWSIMGNINYVIHKPEAQSIVALSSQADRATAADNMYRKSVLSCI